MATVSAVVPTVGTRDTLRRVVAALCDEAALGEVVVAWDRAEDPASLPRLQEAVPRGGAGRPLLRHVFTGGGKGPGAARNAGAAAARGDVLILVDDDVIPEAGSVAALLRSCADGRTAAAGRVRRHPEVPESLYTRFAYAGAVHGAEAGGAAGAPLAFCSALAALPRSAFRELAGFDEGLGIYYEDGELAWRLQRSGVALRWCRDAVGAHLREMDRRWFVERCGLLGAQIGLLRRRAPAFAASIRVVPDSAARLAPALVLAWPALRRMLPLAERLPPPLGLQFLRVAHAAGILSSLHAAEQFGVDS